MLGRMAVRGHADARRVLREYVAYGRYWQRAIDQLIGEYDGPRSATPWPEVVGGLDAVLVERFASDDALAEALAGLDPRERPWTMWSVENPRIARAFALEQEGTGAARRRRRLRRSGAARASARCPRARARAR